MKSKLTILIFLLLLPFSAFSQQQTERITNYHTEIVVNKDSSISVTENISIYVNHDDIRLGIVRVLPQSYNFNGKNITTPIKDVSVFRNGAPENFWLETNSIGELEIVIGAETSEVLLPIGVHNYVIKWSSENHIRGFKDYDEIYFNVTGNDWIFPIVKASATVVLPKGVNAKQAAGYIGKYNSTEKIDAVIDNNKVFFESPRYLKEGEGLTVAVGFPKGIVTPAVTQTAYWSVVDGIIETFYPYINRGSVVQLQLLLLLTIFYIIVWFKFGKDDPLGVIVPIYEAPDGMTPGVAAAVWGSGKVDTKKAFTASLVNMARVGAIRLEDEKIIKADKEPVNDEESQLYSTLFKKSNTVDYSKQSQSLSKGFTAYSKWLKQKAKSFFSLKKSILLFGIAVNIGLYLILPGGKDMGIRMLLFGFLCLFYSPFFIIGFTMESKAKFLFLAFILTHFSVFAVAIVSIGGDFTIATFVTLVLFVAVMGLHIFFYTIMGKPTEEGTELLTSLYGLYMFIKATDENRYKLITPDIFEKNLPYAIVFGLEKKWVKEFSELFPYYKPEWSNEIIHRDTFVIMRNSFATSTISESKSYSRSGGFGGGGFSSSGSSGGGSSGGGSGGGGGRGR